MDRLWIYILQAIVYGIICGGVYTWMSRRRVGTWRLMLRSTLWFTALGAVLSWMSYLILK